jgi:protein O-mannosyl-transferase
MTTSTPFNSSPLLKHRSLLTGLVLMLAAWLLYSPSLKYGFIYYDDVRVLRDHPELYGQKTLAADLKAIFVTGYPREEPLLLRDVTWAIDSRIFGFGNAFGYHLGNVLAHGVVVAVLFAFLFNTTRRYNFALITTTAYLLLAVHMEPVAWIMGRKDILSALFMLLALLAQAQRLEAKNIATKAGWYFAVLLCLIAGLFSKISVLAFPAMLFLHALFLPHLRGEQPPNAPFPWRPAFREALLIIPAFIISGITFVWYQRILDQMGIFDRGYTAHGLAHLWNLLMVNPLVFWSYLLHLFVPVHLAVLYSWPDLQSPYPLWQIIVSLATVAGILATAFWLLLRRKDLFFYFASALALMIPYLNLVYIGIWVADRYVYFTSFCVIAILVALAETAWPVWKTSLRQIVAVVGVLLVANNLFQTISYQTQWRDGESLWQYHIALPNAVPKSYDNLGAFYFAQFTDAGEKHDVTAMDAAIKKMTVVVQAGMDEYWPDHHVAPPNKIAFLFFLQSLVEDVTGKPQAALESLLTSDKLQPGFDSTQYNLSRVYKELAQSAADEHQREIYYQSARDRFAEYIKLAFRDRVPPPDVSQEMADLEAKCAAFKQKPVQ